MSEDQNMALRKKDSLDRMMIEANSYMESVDRHGSVSVSRFQADARMVAAPEESRLSEEDKKRIIEAMRTDTAAAESLKEKYPNLYATAKKLDKDMNTVADYGNLQKLAHGVTAFGRSKARSERDRIKARKEALNNHRFEKFQERRGHYSTALKDGRSKNEQRIRELKKKAEDPTVPEAVRDECNYEIVARGANYMNYDNPLGESVLSVCGLREMMQRQVQNSDEEMTRKAALSKAWASKDQDNPFNTPMKYNHFYTDELPLLCSKDGETITQNAERILQTAKDVTTMKGAAGEKEEDQKAAFNRVFDLATDNYTRVFAFVGNNPQLFTGSIHPDNLMYSQKKSGNFTVNLPNGESEYLRQLYDIQRLCAASTEMLDRIGKAPAYRKADKRVKDGVAMMSAYVDSVYEYCRKQFAIVDEWEKELNKEPTEKELTYQTESLQQILEDKEGEAGLR